MSEQDVIGGLVLSPASRLIAQITLANRLEKSVFIGYVKYHPIYFMILSCFVYVRRLEGLGVLSRYSNGLRAGRSEFKSRQGPEIFLFPTVFRPRFGPILPPIQWVLGDLSPEVKR
jgi:hypothetical protein